jgi:UDP-2,3-diacylglucosamine hydrolase
VKRRAWPVLEAPAAWRCIDVISDLHLDADHPQTFLAWHHYLRHSPAQAVFILGDLFEVWVGDDAITLEPQGFEARCVRTLRKAANQRDIFFLHGNRDFLIGEAFAQSCGVHLLEDPTVLQFAGHRWLLSHGDAMCLADTAYQEFRSQVRSADWQRPFLAQPLLQRRAAARDLRARSEMRKQQHQGWVDLDTAAVRQALELNAALVGIIHTTDVPEWRRFRDIQQQHGFKAFLEARDGPFRDLDAERRS